MERYGEVELFAYQSFTALSQEPEANEPSRNTAKDRTKLVCPVRVLNNVPFCNQILILLSSYPAAIETPSVNITVALTDTQPTQGIILISVPLLALQNLIDGSLMSLQKQEH